MSEWFKEHDWKSCVRLKRTGGSNPLLCATITHPFEGAFFRGAEKSLTRVYELSEVRASTVRNERKKISLRLSAVRRFVA